MMAMAMAKFAVRNVLLAAIAACSLAGIEPKSLAASAGQEKEKSKDKNRDRHAATSRIPTTSSPFAIRGTLPWHNFLSGPTAWNESDYRAYLDELQRDGLNFVGFHCYTGGAERYAPYVEPMIRLEYRGVLPEAGFDTSMTARWGYRPLAVKDFGFDTASLFRGRQRDGVFGADAAIRARTKEDRYRLAHDLMRKVMRMAHERGIQVAMGFEFGVHPPEFASIVPPESRIGGAMLPDPTHPANIAILYAGLDDLLNSYPELDYVWLWLHEHSMFVGAPSLTGPFGEAYRREGPRFSTARNEHDVFTGVWSLIQIRQAQEYLARRSPRTRLVIGGWGGGPQLPPVLQGLDTALPPDVIFSCLNPGMGSEGHVPVLTDIARHRPVWSIPWLEGDGWLWHLQLRASMVGSQVKAAQEAKLAGVIGIHWRVEEVRPSLEAFALAASSPAPLPSVEEFYRGHCEKWYGTEAASELAPRLARIELDRGLAFVSSPEYYPYEPTWGRMSPALAAKLADDMCAIDALAAKAKATTGKPGHARNLRWLADNLRFALFLDQVGRKLEPAYRLQERVIRGEFAGKAGEAGLEGTRRLATESLARAPIEDLFRTFARRVRSPGELGELSALNQKLWLEYLELKAFLQKPASSWSGPGL